jgi:hypothetical protein
MRIYFRGIQLQLLEAASTARLFSWPGIPNQTISYTETDPLSMSKIEQLLLDLIGEVKAHKQNAPSEDMARGYAIIYTDLEKIYSYYLMYVLPGEYEAEETQ